MSKFWLSAPGASGFLCAASALCLLLAACGGAAPETKAEPAKTETPAMQPAKGVNVSIDTLFEDDIRDPIKRSKRLEGAVVELRRDLTEAQDKIQALSTQVATLQNVPAPADPAIKAGDTPMELMPETATTPTTTTAIMPAVTTPAPSATPPAKEPGTKKPDSSALAGIGLRVGAHPGKTRLVIDLNGPVTYKADLDNGEKLIVIELAKAAWRGAATQVLSSGMVASYSTQPLDNAGGTRLILALKRETSIISQSVLKPESAGQPYRLVLDLKS